MMDERMTESERATLCRRIDELCAENERLRQENQSVGMAAYEVGYRDGSIHYELEHCPACQNIADLQEALEENEKLRKERDFYFQQVTENGERTQRAIDALNAENAKLRVERDEWRRVAVSKQDIIDHMRDANAENAKLGELAENLLMAFVVLETPNEQQKCIDRAIELQHELNVLPIETFDAGEL